MWVSFGRRNLDHDCGPLLRQWNMTNSQARNCRRDVLLKYLFEPDFWIRLNVYAFIETSWLMVLFGHPINNLAAVSIGKRGDIAGHFDLFVVFLVDCWRRFVFEIQTLLDVARVQRDKIVLL